MRPVVLASCGHSDRAHGRANVESEGMETFSSASRGNSFVEV
jgi:hypothetical protein